MENILNFCRLSILRCWFINIHCFGTYINRIKFVKFRIVKSGLLKSITDHLIWKKKSHCLNTDFKTNWDFFKFCAGDFVAFSYIFFHSDFLPWCSSDCLINSVKSNVSGNSNRSLNFTELSVMGSYWNLMRCKCKTGGNEEKSIPFSAS